MRLDPWTVATIVGMALATYASRGGGYWLFRRMAPSAAVRTVLGYLPGALFVSFVAPALAAGSWPQWVGGAVTLAVSLATGRLSLAILGGTAAAWVVWSLR